MLTENFEELLPIIHTPTVSAACHTYGLMFKSLPRGLFITLEDRGRVFRILKNWPERSVQVRGRLGTLFQGGFPLETQLYVPNMKGNANAF